MDRGYKMTPALVSLLEKWIETETEFQRVPERLRSFDIKKCDAAIQAESELRRGVRAEASRRLKEPVK